MVRNVKALTRSLQTIAEVLPEDGGPKGQQRKQAAAAAGALARTRSLPQEVRPLSPPVPTWQNERPGTRDAPRGFGGVSAALERTRSVPAEMSRIGGGQEVNCPHSKEPSDPPARFPVSLWSPAFSTLFTKYKFKDAWGVKPNFSARSLD